MLFHNLISIAERHPRSGVKQAGVFHPYPELAERAERLAGGLASVGIGAGDPVAILVPNSVDLFVISYALYALGAVVVPLNVNSAARELQWAAEKCEVVAIIARNESLAQAQKILEDTGKKLPLIVTGDGDLSIRQLEKHAPPASIKTWDADTQALYLFSSGSTGRPKIVPHTQGEMYATGFVGTNAIEYTPDDVVLNMLPGHHALGYMSGPFEVANSGATTVYWSDPLPIALSRGRLLQALEAEKITVLPAVPFVLDTLASASTAVDVSRLRLVYCGGVALKRSIFDKFRERFGIAIRQSVGMTEAGQISTNMDPDIEGTWNSVGKPRTGISVEVIPREGVTEPGVGELFLRSPALTKGYLRADPSANLSFQNGGMMTGDLGRLDERGNVYITGRAKLILEVAGEKIDPLEVEDVLMTHPAVAEAVVVGVPDPRTGEQRLKAVVVKKAEETGDVLIKFAKARLSSHKVPALVEFRDEIPKSATGKILRGQLID